MRSLFLALFLCSCARGPQVWYTPNIGSADMVDLFEHPEQWPRARSHTHFFGFYARQLLPAGSCSSCGRNSLDNFRRVDAFTRLAEWGIDAYVEAPAIKAEDCDGSLSTQVTLKALRSAHESGGVIRYVAMDEPLLGGDRCALPIAETVSRTSVYISRIVGEGGTSVGDIEPYPIIPASRILDWVAALQKAGTTPAFLHLDVDHAYASRLHLDVPADLRSLKAGLKAAQIPFGVILWGGDGTSDAAYSADVKNWAQQVLSALNEAPDHITFQSWVVSPDGAQRVPMNLPESDPAVYSHTRLINETTAQLKEKW
jgi:hypothetical protein